MGNKILFFLPLGTINDATEYYVNTLQEAFEKAGYVVYKSGQISDLRKFKNILTIEAKWFFFAKILNPSALIMNWFQGVVAEEAYMTTNSVIRKKLWQFFESFTLRYSQLNIYVSRQMKQYFEKNYIVRNNAFFIMPCFNKGMRLDLIDEKKYLNPSFVYAGSLAKWQCVEKTLEIYYLLEKEIPGSKLTLLTKEKDYALELLKKYNIKNFEIKYVPLHDLEVELAKYKYGFLLREDHVVNNVATPTKMNSYLSVGVIPIYSDVIFDYNLKFSQCKSFIVHNVVNDSRLVLDKVLKSEHNFNINVLIKDDICTVFDNYYNRDNYCFKLSTLLKKLKELK